MGNRKERRRQASKASSGRRVKLDLFAEPSGDLGGSAENDGLGGDEQSKGRSGLPNSPSSSGQQPENPLLLLGQYSDEDELDDDSNKFINDVAVANSSNKNGDEVKSALHELGHNLDIKGAEDQTINLQVDIPNSDQLDRGQRMENGGDREIGDLASSDLCQEMELTVPDTSNAQVIGDVSSGWKIVMHEESNSYYYWNTETGETSWEVPDVLAQTTKLNCDPRISSVDGKSENVPVGTEGSNGYSNADMIEGSSNIISQGIELHGDGSQMNGWNLGCQSGITDDTVANESRNDSSSHLVQYGEGLLEKLKSLQGSKDQLQGLNWITKCILEIEIRLFDFKSLLSHGPSLLPFWMHSEIQLKRLESAINDEMSKIVCSEKSHAVEATPHSFPQGEISVQENMVCETEADKVENEEHISSVDDCHCTPSVDAVTEGQEVKGSLLTADHVSGIGSPTRHMESGASEQVNGVVALDEATTKKEIFGEEDVDMDVDMDVDVDVDTAIAYALSSKEFAAPEQPIQSSPYATLVSEDTAVAPPPPNEEWIPPPPPDNDQIPPPPPDEPPPEPPNPPLSSYPVTGQPSYAEQYSYSYPVSGFDYYGHTVAEATDGSYYVNAEGYQVAVPHVPVYYGAIPSTYSETAQVVTNPVDPVTYYGLQDGTGPAPPVVSDVNSLQYHRDAAPLSYDNHTSDSIAKAGSSVLSVEVPSTSATVQAPATVMAKDHASGSLSISVSTADPLPDSSVAAKVQSKVQRTKKRTIAAASSLRSNKKVSSLVDKWKAAKEELLEDEEEQEDTYELLERKRKREIEEWYAHQISSGEAKDNANFQPLGGNWREKVKRRKAQLAREAAQAAPESPTKGNQQPDLAEHSKDLPSGWQVYWDESSKQVYYGNTVTSETSWTRPTSQQHES